MAHSPESLVGADIIRPRAIGDRPYNSICPVRTPYRIEDALHCGTAATSLQRNFTLHSFPPAQQTKDLLLTFFLDRCIVAGLRFLERGDFFLRFLEHFHHPEKYFRVFVKWSLLSLLVGLLGGALGAAFSHTLTFVSGLRASRPWLLFLLPVGGLVTVALYRCFKMSGNRGANEIIEAILHNKPVTAATAPVIFLSTAVTHLVGGSAGREGAALQLGMDAGFAAALGLIGLFCCVTNSPISAIVLSVEMFGSANLSSFAFVCVIVFVLSGNWGIYSSQIIQFSKARLVRKNHRPSEIME